jgi:hypothetical protein
MSKQNCGQVNYLFVKGSRIIWPKKRITCGVIRFYRVCKIAACQMRLLLF